MVDEADGGDAGASAAGAASSVNTTGWVPCIALMFTCHDQSAFIGGVNDAVEPFADAIAEVLGVHDAERCLNVYIDRGASEFEGCFWSAIGVLPVGRAGKAIKVLNEIKQAKNGAEIVRMGQAGEAAVRGAYKIGDKATYVVNGRVRIADGMTGTAVSEVKNVKSQGLTRQIQDYIDYSQAKGLRFDLFVRTGTALSQPLQNAVRNGLVNIKYIPKP